MAEKAEDYLDHKEEQGYITAGVRFDWEGNDVDQNPQEAYRLMIAAERHQELNYHAKGIKAKELSGTSLKRSQLAQAIIHLKSKISNITMDTLGKTVEEMAETNNKIGSPVYLAKVLEQDKNYEEDVVEAENETLLKESKNHDLLEELPFAKEDMEEEMQVEQGPELK